MIVLGCLRILDRFRECSQRCLLVPILLHLQVHSCPLASPSGYWVSSPITSHDVKTLIISAAVPKSSSAPSSNQSLPATFLELVHRLLTFALRSIPLPLTRLCKRIDFGLFVKLSSGRCFNQYHNFEGTILMEEL